MPSSLTTACARSAMLAVGLLVLPLAALAQDDSSGAPPMTNSPSMSATKTHSHHHRNRWMRDLNLTESQKTQIKEIRQQFKSEHPDQSTVTKSDRMALMERIKAVLTPEQREKMHENMRMRRNRSHPDEMPTVAP